MRAIVITESLEGRALPAPLAQWEDRRYPHLLDERTPIEIIECAVPAERAAEAALALAKVLLPELYYAHLLDEQRMLVAFPGIVAQIDRGDAAACERAQAVGALFKIPADQMRFLEMFDEDHPDAPAATARDGAAR
ncbi:hypothetical protein SAMN05414137_1645 [Streptacidiphilus jiangxiensis]|uniref:Uncharacterized protein n=2 Tax=Streptacidiphilus jiangxiensis TaxID=235985 RepID=A0A1H8BH59_STRJI|nr:hypothetical protein SAMN05414137_1645 [Streptacidiphilus jiangxiensis]